MSSFSVKKQDIPQENTREVNSLYNRITDHYDDRKLSLIKCGRAQDGDLYITSPYVIQKLISAYVNIPGTTAKVKYWKIGKNGNLRQSSVKVMRGTIKKGGVHSIFGTMAREHGKELPHGRVASLGEDATLRDIRAHFFVISDLKSAFPSYVKHSVARCADTMYEEALAQDASVLEWLQETKAIKEIKRDQ